MNDELQTKKEVWQTKKQFSDQMSSKVASLQRQLQAVSAGMTADEDDGSTVSLNDKVKHTHTIAPLILLDSLNQRNVVDFRLIKI